MSERLIPIEAAPANRARIDLSVPVKAVTGPWTLTPDPLEDRVPRVDWTPFFQSREPAEHCSEILEESVVGETARTPNADAQALRGRIGRIGRDGRLEARSTDRVR